MSVEIDTNIRLKTFKLYSVSDDSEFNEWLSKQEGKINIKSIKEIGIKEYLRIVVYYTTINK